MGNARGEIQPLLQQRLGFTPAPALQREAGQQLARLHVRRLRRKRRAQMAFALAHAFGLQTDGRQAVFALGFVLGRERLHFLFHHGLAGGLCSVTGLRHRLVRLECHGLHGNCSRRCPTSVTPGVVRGAASFTGAGANVCFSTFAGAAGAGSAFGLRTTVSLSVRAGAAGGAVTDGAVLAGSAAGFTGAGGGSTFDARGDGGRATPEQLPRRSLFPPRARRVRAAP